MKHKPEKPHGRRNERKADPDRRPPQERAPNGPGDAADRNLDAAYEGKEHGEGNYQAAKQYGRSVRTFVRSGEVDRAAREAEPESAQEARELEAAEEHGRERSKGEDPAAKSHRK